MCRGVGRFMADFRSRLLQATFISYCICAAFPAQSEPCVEVPFARELGLGQAIDKYLKIALDPATCTQETSAPENCEPEIQKREADYLLAFAGGDELAPAEAEGIIQSAYRAADLARPITGLAGYLTPNDKSSGLMGFMILNSKRGRDNPKGEFEVTVAKLGLDRVPNLYEIYSRFMIVESETCLTLNISNTRGKIVVSSTWIKSEATSQEKSQCAARGVIGGLGLNADDVFSTASPDSAAPNDIPDVYLKYIALQYNEQIARGYDATQVTEAVKEISCK